MFRGVSLSVHGRLSINYRQVVSTSELEQIHELKQIRLENLLGSMYRFLYKTEWPLFTFSDFLTL